MESEVVGEFEQWVRTGEKDEDRMHTNRHSRIVEKTPNDNPQTVAKVFQHYGASRWPLDIRWRIGAG